MAEKQNPPTLREDCIRSAEIYLKYLEANRENGKGMLRARVRGIQTTLFGSDMVLQIDREIRNPEEMTIRIGGTIYENREGHTSFIIHSTNRRQVTISPSAELAEHISRAEEQHEKIFLEIDLTFLVKRIKEWYEQRGDSAGIPSVHPKAGLAPDNPIMLSDNQYDCAAVAMSSPLSYIWGAPGTGKTKHVLASCIYSCIKTGKKAVLVAPTNNALEQSLKGLLPVLEEVGISPDGKVLRMGFPSDDFSASWPNVCEAGAYAFVKAEMDEEISQLKHENGLIDETFEVRAGKVREGALERYPGTNEKDLKEQKRKNTAKINELLSQSHKMTEGKGSLTLLSRFCVIAATVDSCVHRLSPGGDFRPDHVFLDEAGYCSVIKGMALTGFGCPLTMLGDHRQLPPVFDCEDWKMLRDPETQIVRLWDISILYMENVMESECRTSLYRLEASRPMFNRTTIGVLQETYRFGPALTQILAGRVYGKAFCSKAVNETRILYVNAPKKTEEKGKDEHGEYRRISTCEQRCIREIMEHNLFHWEYSVGILSPYSHQRNRLAGSMSRLLKKNGQLEDMDDDVVNVHKSQGREWDVVLFSVTDSFDEKYFTDTSKPVSLKLINTAVSRPKKLLILVGDADDWKNRPGQLISDLFRVAEEVGTNIRFEDYL